MLASLVLALAIRQGQGSELSSNRLKVVYRIGKAYGPHC